MQPKPGKDEDNHDTIAVLARDQKGNLGGVCTTSGLALKLPGRVGDSPLIGHGLYVDDRAGAAGATGVGEDGVTPDPTICLTARVAQAMVVEEESEE